VNPALPGTVVVVDTDVFSKVFVLASGPERRELRDRLVGRMPVIATQTYAELRVWPEMANWGKPRRAALAEILASTQVVPVLPEVVDAFVELTVECRATGHALAAKIHTADRWVAATAVALDRPLLSLDGVYAGTPHLALV
jgi:predicted nucleic acid-binding protein